LADVTLNAKQFDNLKATSSPPQLVPGPLLESQISIVIREMILGLEYLHSQGKMHRDVKAANVLFADDGSVKLADLGVAAQFGATFAKRHTLVGTPYWMVRLI
jgi:serine/threonine-protein kinase 24/25/MST4